MPIYEYFCLRCKKSFSFLAGVGSDSGDPACPRCGGSRLKKLISRVARIRSKDSVLEDLADPSKLGDLEDSRSMAQWAKKMGQALGDETGEDFGEEMEQMLDEGPGGKEELGDD